MEERFDYDVIVIGAGIAGGIIALELGKAGKKVLILEAGPPIPTSREEYLAAFFQTTLKTPNSPYPPITGDPAQANAPRAAVPDFFDWRNPKTSYLVQKGPVAWTSGYERVAGGTTWHWMGTSLRWSAKDFRLKKEYGVGRDWPFGYDELAHWYEKAENLIGVSAEVAPPEGDGKQVQNQSALTDTLGITYRDGYEYPMRRIRPTLLDQVLAAGLNGTHVDDAKNPVVVTGTPAARNSQLHNGRPACMGNANCVPICPIQAKFDATVLLNAALDTGNVTLQARSVVDRLEIGPDDRIQGVHYLQYETPKGPKTGSGSLRARIVVLAANAIESPKILLNSATEKFPNGAANSSGEVGCNLMDQPSHLSWARLPEPVWPWRAPNSTSGIETLRDGDFRSERASFRVEIGNKGWMWANNDPYTTTLDLITGTDQGRLNADRKKLFGTKLRKEIQRKLSCQFRILFEMEQLPHHENRVTLSREYTDHLGIPRPEIHYSIDDYTARGFEKARQVTDQWFRKLGVRDAYQNAPPADMDPKNPTAGYFHFHGQDYIALGIGHIMGTHRMGTKVYDSVVDPEQRSWDHRNLFLAGSGVFPTSANPNPTLTLAALCLWASETIQRDLKQGPPPIPESSRRPRR